MYLLKRALDYIEKKNSYLEVKRENGDQIFVWEPSKKNYWLDIWQEFVLLIEMLSETQVIFLIVHLKQNYLRLTNIPIGEHLPPEEVPPYIFFSIWVCHTNKVGYYLWIG